MTDILDGAALAKTLRSEVAARVRELTGAGHRRPGLAAVLVGDDPASQVYVGSKTRLSKEAGFESRTVRVPPDAALGEVLRVVEELNGDEEIDGILVQLPLPGDLDETAVINALDPAKDVDGLHPESVGRLWLGQPGFRPATPSGIVELLHRNGIALEGARAVIVGRSNLVGKPLAALLLERNATVTLCHSRTANLAATCRAADILVAAIGRPAFFGPDHVHAGSVVIDVGINRISDPDLVARLIPEGSARLAKFEESGSLLVGDVDYHAVAETVAAITPVPGGVGPLTVAMLLVNTLHAARLRQGLDPQ